MAFAQLVTLTEPWWGRQPGESPNAYQRFSQYREQPRGERSLAKLAESLARDPRTIQQQAQGGRWEERAAAWDAEQSRQHQERISAHAERLAEAQIQASTELLHAVRTAVRDTLKSGETLERDEVGRWSDAAVKLAQSAQKTGESVRTVYRHAQATAQGDGTTSGVQLQEIEVPELAGLSPQGKHDRISEIVSSLSRFASYEQREREQGYGGA